MAKLFSVEFYTWVRRALTPEGIAVINAPVFDRGDAKTISAKRLRSNSILLSTLDAAGFRSIRPYRAVVESFVALSNAEDRFGGAPSDGKVALSALTPEILTRITTQEFPHVRDRELVNSVFRPTYGWLDSAFQ